MIETQPRPTIRTVVASFLFTDLVGFSKGTATDQYAAKARLSACLRRNLEPLQERDYWIKDTGDGALIAFVSNPEHALYMALALAQEYARPADGAGSASLRTGLHLGTVKESVDVEARRNFIGDGINAAKRIMDFADPGQIAASRSYFEAIANLDSEYAALFRHLGAPDDKHGRAHELYALTPSGSVLEKLRSDIAAESREDAFAEGTKAASAASPAEPHAGATRIGRPAMLFGLAALLGVASILVYTKLREPSPQPEISTARPKERPAPEAKKEAAAPADTASAARRSASQEPPASTVAPPPTVSSPRRGAEPPEPTRSAASPAASPRAATEVKPRVSPPAVPETAGAAARSSPRCSRIVEKAALGEPLTPDEQRELANSCR